MITIILTVVVIIRGGDYCTPSSCRGWYVTLCPMFDVCLSCIASWPLGCHFKRAISNVPVSAGTGLTTFNRPPAYGFHKNSPIV